MSNNSQTVQDRACSSMNAVNSSQWTRHGRKKHDGELVTDAKKHDSELVTENSLWRVHRVTSSLVTLILHWWHYTCTPFWLVPLFKRLITVIITIIIIFIKYSNPSHKCLDDIYLVQRANLFPSCTVSLYVMYAFGTFCLYKMFVSVLVH